MWLPILYIYIIHVPSELIECTMCLAACSNLSTCVNHPLDSTLPNHEEEVCRLLSIQAGAEGGEREGEGREKGRKREGRNERMEYEWEESQNPIYFEYLRLVCCRKSRGVIATPILRTPPSTGNSC